MSTLVLASGNRGKWLEFRSILHDVGVEVLPQRELNVEEIDETGLSFVENALLKARHAAHCTGLPALADDSGLCVPHLGGAPGLYSARYAGKHGDDTANNAKLLHQLSGVSGAGRQAWFVCVLALLQHAHDPSPLLIEARWHGRILDAPRGKHGFGYDPLFLPDGQDISAAELDPNIKNRLSHRGQACVLLRTHLQRATP